MVILLLLRLTSVAQEQASALNFQVRLLREPVVGVVPSYTQNYANDPTRTFRLRVDDVLI